MSIPGRYASSFRFFCSRRESFLQFIQNPQGNRTMRKSTTRTFTLQLILAMLLSGLSAVAADTPNPATEKFQQDLKAAVVNGSITMAQIKEIQANMEVLKNARSEQTPGSPVDLLTPYRAVSSIKTTMAGVDAKDRETLRQDFEAVQASRPETAAPATPPGPGQKLGKDIFKAVLLGTPTEAQVTQLQTSLNDLQAAKSDQGRPLQKLKALNTAKAQIESVMNAGSFRPEDRQAVLDDLNSLGPQGGGMRN
jgi:hypothetical protein